MPQIGFPVRHRSMGRKVATLLGDNRATVEGLADALGQALVRLAFILTGDSDEAQDVAQSVFLRLLSSDLSNVLDLEAYARRAVVNEVLTRRRRVARFWRTAPLLATSSAVESPDSAIVASAHLWGVLTRLSGRQRAVLVLRYLEDLDDQAIASLIGCSQATVRSIAARALAKLRGGLADEADSQIQTGSANDKHQ